jgi:hypothetical protein
MFVRILWYHGNMFFSYCPLSIYTLDDWIYLKELNCCNRLNLFPPPITSKNKQIYFMK